MHERHPQPTIVAKTAEQLKDQVKLVNLRRSLRYYDNKPYEISDELFQMVPADFKQIILREKQLRVQTGQTSEFLDQYQTFLSHLRKIRKNQRPQIEAAVTGFEDPSQRRQVFLQSLSFSQPLAHQVLQTINGEETYLRSSSPHLFTDEEIQFGKQSQENLVATVNKADPPADSE